MSISRPFIARPIATSLLMAALIVVGLLAAHELPISALPIVEQPNLEVSTSWPGASPEVMAASITTPLEARLSQITGLTSIASVSSYGVSNISLQFALNRKIDSAAQDVQAAISAASGQLPRGLLYPPVYNKVNSADPPIVILAVSSQTLPLPRVNEYAETILGQKLSQVDGVGLVSLGGGQKRALRIKINPSALAHRGLSFDDVRAQIAKFSLSAPKGSIDGAYQAFSIGADDQITSPERFLDLVIAHAEGSPVRLRDVADVREGVENERLSGWYNNGPAIVMSVSRQPGANVIATVDRIKALLPKLRASMPPGVKVDLVSDRTESIRASISGVWHTLVLSALVVIGVILVFLRRLWATLIPSMAIPLSLIGTFAFMYLAGYSIDNLSLMALTVAAGFVVDDAIVMVENIVRHLERGERPLEAALNGSREIAFTVVSLTISLIAVFVPILFMEGAIGRLFREFGITLSVAVIVSALVSLTLTPMLCARFLRASDPDRPSRRGGISAFDRLQLGYMRALAWSMRNRAVVYGLTSASLLATLVLFAVVPKGLFPVQDNGLILAVLDVAEDGSSGLLRQRLQEACAIILKDPDVANVQGVSGVNFSNATPNTAQLYINLVSRERGRASARVVMDRLSMQLAQLVGAKIHMQPSQELTLDSRPSRTQFQISVQDADGDELALWAPRLLEALRARPELRDVTSDQQSHAQQIDLRIDRDRAAVLGVSIQALDEALNNAFGQRSISTIYTQTNQYQVIIEADATALRSPSPFDDLFVRSSRGELIPLKQLVTRTTSTTELSRAHLGRFPLATISFNLADGYALSDATNAVAAAQRAVAPPERVVVGSSGAIAQFQASLVNQPFLILTAIVVVYIVLGVLYESYIHPLTILSTLPSAGVGSLAALYIGGYALDVFSLIGMILLIGIVKKNAIMMIDFAIDAQRLDGRTPREAIMEACRLRFRPIMMTTMAALLGALPLVVDQAVGAELRRPLGISLIGGLLLSQVLTLFSTPAIFLLFADLERRAFGRVAKADADAPREVAVT